MVDGFGVDAFGLHIPLEPDMALCSVMYALTFIGCKRAQVIAEQKHSPSRVERHLSQITFQLEISDAWRMLFLLLKSTDQVLAAMWKCINSPPILNVSRSR